MKLLQRCPVSFLLLFLLLLLVSSLPSSILALRQITPTCFPAGGSAVQCQLDSSHFVFDTEFEVVGPATYDYLTVQGPTAQISLTLRSSIQMQSLTFFNTESMALVIQDCTITSSLSGVDKSGASVIASRQMTITNTQISGVSASKDSVRFSVNQSLTMTSSSLVSVTNGAALSAEIINPAASITFTSNTFTHTAVSNQAITLSVYPRTPASTILSGSITVSNNVISLTASTSSSSGAALRIAATDSSSTSPLKIQSTATIDGNKINVTTSGMTAGLGIDVALASTSIASSITLSSNTIGVISSGTGRATGLSLYADGGRYWFAKDLNIYAANTASANGAATGIRINGAFNDASLNLVYSYLRVLTQGTGTSPARGLVFDSSSSPNNFELRTHSLNQVTTSTSSTAYAYTFPSTFTNADFYIGNSSSVAASGLFSSALPGSSTGTLFFRCSTINGAAISSSTVTASYATFGTCGVCVFANDCNVSATAYTTLSSTGECHCVCNGDVSQYGWIPLALQCPGDLSVTTTTTTTSTTTTSTTTTTVTEGPTSNDSSTETTTTSTTTTTTTNTTTTPVPVINQTIIASTQSEEYSYWLTIWIIVAVFSLIALAVIICIICCCCCVGGGDKNKKEDDKNKKTKQRPRPPPGPEVFALRKKYHDKQAIRIAEEAAEEIERDALLAAQRPDKANPNKQTTLEGRAAELRREIELSKEALRHEGVEFTEDDNDDINGNGNNITKLSNPDHFQGTLNNHHNNNASGFYSDDENSPSNNNYNEEMVGPDGIVYGARGGGHHEDISDDDSDGEFFYDSIGRKRRKPTSANRNNRSPSTGLNASSSSQNGTMMKHGRHNNNSNKNQVNFNPRIALVVGRDDPDANFRIPGQQQQSPPKFHPPEQHQQLQPPQPQPVFSPSPLPPPPAPPAPIIQQQRPRTPPPPPPPKQQHQQPIEDILPPPAPLEPRSPRQLSPHPSASSDYKKSINLPARPNLPTKASATDATSPTPSSNVNNNIENASSTNNSRVTTPRPSQQQQKQQPSGSDNNNNSGVFSPNNNNNKSNQNNSQQQEGPQWKSNYYNPILHFGKNTKF